MDKKQRRLYTTTIYAVGFLQMGGIGISPVLAELGKAFPQYSTTAIQFTSSIVSLFVVLTNLITGWLCTRFPKKYLAAFGCGLRHFCCPQTHRCLQRHCSFGLRNCAFVCTVFVVCL